ncbi:hypothetical protein SAMN04488096_1086 [Mesonia phycicola]|uniref:Serine aminopeptidase S33 domain-containing protein n=1 Tax=Mesonia phycicola TaxID=579105 RepID=A0A1M6GF76_9FLAO|nr:alpha/beta hydrolase [Mesonia phycicola]SHJ08624.1 hypothetical protein SAMN04488096_1086 [Mesonia phycicola]
MKYFLISISFFSFLFLQAQEKFIANDIRINKYIEGTLLAPKQQTVPLAIIINGAGPIDRDGNQRMMENNSIKKLAESLSKKGIATFRYDKRTLKATKLNIKEKDMRFDDFIEDANSVINRFKPIPNFNKIYIIGHNQGSLVGMVAAQNNVDGFISIGGAGQPLDSVIIKQIGAQMPGLKENAVSAFKDLREKGKVKNYSPALETIFKKEVQPFMLSWIKYNPQVELKKLHIPTLIINGDNDFQVNTEEAKKLKAAKPDSKLVIIENMNYIFNIIDKNDDIANQKSYNETHHQISTELIEEISNFILNKE